jgi:signal transduction histidine kinase
MEQFLYTVSHDLKSPLVTILGYSGYIKEDTSAGRLDRVADFLEEIGIAVNRMVRLINGLLDLGRIGRQMNPISPIPMTELIQGIVQQHAVEIAEKNVIVDVQEDMPTINADKERMTEAFDNLIVNALNYGHGDPQPRITIGSVITANQVRFFVKDNGPGIAAKYQTKIFELFQRLQNDRKGTGLGLTIVKRVAEVHGGRVWVESQPSQGATFWLAFPLSIVKIDEEPVERLAYSPRSEA